MGRILLFLLLAFPLTEAQCNNIMKTVADITECSDDGTENNFPSFAANSRFSVCCQLRNDLCNTTTLNQNLTLLPDNCSEDCAHITMSRVDPCRVKLDVNNASLKDKGQYSCLLDGCPKNRQTITIYEPPEAPVILSFVCTDDKRITVAFDRGMPRLEYVDLYEVIMIEYTVFSRNVSLCTGNSTAICPGSGRQCVCHYQEKYDIGHPEYRNPYHMNVTVVVTVTRAFFSASTNKTFSVMANIIPGPPMRLKVVNVTDNDAFVQFCVGTKTYNLLRFPIAEGRPIWHHLWLLKNQGTPEFLNVSLPSRPYYRCFRVHLPRLTPFTNYTVIVFASGGGGQGEMNLKEFKTEMSVPRYPPLVDVFGFSRYFEGANGDEIVPALVITWPELPQEAQGGTNLSYVVQVAGSDFIEHQTVTGTSTVFFGENITSGLLSAKIWAQNVVGQTKNHTEFAVPGNTDMAMPIAHCEFNGDGATVYVHLNGNRNVTQVGIHWCRKYTDTQVPGRSICQEYPDTTFFTATSEDVMHFKLPLTRTNHHPEVIKQRVIVYEALEKLNRAPGINRTATATVTYNAQGIQDLKDYDFYEDTMDKTADSYYYDMASDREKRDAEFGAFDSSAINELNRARVLRSLRDKDTVNDLEISPADRFDARYPKVFISLKTQEGLSPLGMIPVSCYFDRSKDEADTTISEEVEYDQTSIYIKWNQRCDPKEPRQFRASYFLVNSATDKKCTQNLNSAEQVFVKMDKPILTKLPRAARYACFQASKNYADPGSAFSKPVMTDALDGYNQSGVTVPAVLGSAGVAACLGIVCCIYNCIKRRNHLRRTTKDSSKVIDPSQNTDSVCKATVVIKANQPSNTVSLDSGRGSASYEVTTKTQSYQNDLENHTGRYASAPSNISVVSESHGSENCRSNQTGYSDDDAEQRGIFEKNSVFFRCPESGSLQSQDPEEIDQNSAGLLIKHSGSQRSTESSSGTESDIND